MTKINPDGLDDRTLRALALLQALAEVNAADLVDPVTGDVTIKDFPAASSGATSVGTFDVSAEDVKAMTSLAVWEALDRAGLARSFHPSLITLTGDGLAYPTGLTLDDFSHRNP